MSDLPDYLKATGLTWRWSSLGPRVAMSTFGTLHIEVQMARSGAYLYMMTFDPIRTICEDVAVTADTLIPTVATRLADRHLTMLLKTAREGADAPVIPALPDPLLAPLNAALRAQLPDALAAQSRATEALVSLGLSLGMTAANLTSNTVEMT